MDKINKNPIIYVTREIERATGLSLNTSGYFIISNFSPFAKSVTRTKKNVLLIKENRLLDTWELLQHPKAKRFIKKIKGNIVVFKNTPQIEKICTENSWVLLNPSAELSNKVEEKISQIEWLGPLKKYLPKYTVLKCKNIPDFLKSQDNYPRFQKFVLQFNRSHTGSGTFLIENEIQLNDLVKKFPEREARIAPYIQGPLFTNNNIVAKDNILLGNINYQITGLKPFTDNPFCTIGNDWELPHKLLNKKQILQYKKIATDVGIRLREHGWKGLFGIDVVINEKTGKLYLLEINCRQPASTTYESQLQYSKICLPAGRQGNLKSAISTFEAHLLALLDTPLKNKQIIPLSTGAQIIQRVTKSIPSLSEPKFYKADNRFTYIRYNNIKLDADLLRLQTTKGIMDQHNTLNHLGDQLRDFVFCVEHKNVWNSPRGAVIIINEKKVLLIKRNKCGQKYYIFPGGTLEKGETPSQTAIREAKEETNLSVTLSKQKPWKSNYELRDEYYFLAETFSGQAELGGPEARRNNSQINYYELEWVKFSDLKKINLLPKDIKDKLCNYLKKH